MLWFDVSFIIIQIVLLLYLFVRYDLNVTKNKGKETKKLAKYTVIFATILMISLIISLIFNIFHTGSKMIDILSMSTGISILILCVSADFKSGFKINNREYKLEKKSKL